MHNIRNLKRNQFFRDCARIRANVRRIIRSTWRRWRTDVCLLRNFVPHGRELEFSPHRKFADIAPEAKTRKRRNAFAMGRSSAEPVAYEMRQRQVRIDKPSVNVRINFKVNSSVVGQRCRKRRNKTKKKKDQYDWRPQACLLTPRQF